MGSPPEARRGQPPRPGPLAARVAPAAAALALLALALAAIVVGAAGCAGSRKAPLETPASVAPAGPLRLVWLPAEAAGASAVAVAVNERLGQVKVAGVTSGARAAVSLEVAQLAIECIEPSPACYAKVGRSLGGDRLMWAEIARGPAPAATVRVALILFDVDAEAEAGRVERTFDDAAAAHDGVAALFEHAFETPARSAGAGAKGAQAGGKRAAARAGDERGDAAVAEGRGP